METPIVPSSFHPAPPTSEDLTQWVLRQIPKTQWEEVFAEDYYAAAQIGPDFLGFLDIYWHLACVIPHHWTIVDLGCAYAPQAYLFARHKAYHGVDLGSPARFSTPNTTHYAMSIGAFLDQHGHQFDLKETFAICSYVPMWGERTTEHIRRHFPNLFVYYPHGGTPLPVPGGR